MNTPKSSLEKHAAALGLAGEDAAPIQRAKPPVATADKVLLGVGCCALAAGTAALSVWMVVPTLILTGTAAVLLVRHLNAANARPDSPAMEPWFQLGGEAVRQMMEEEEERHSRWDRDIGSNPLYHSSLSNISHDDYHRD